MGCLQTHLQVLNSFLVIWMSSFVYRLSMGITIDEQDIVFHNLRKYLEREGIQYNEDSYPVVVYCVDEIEKV